MSVPNEILKDIAQITGLPVTAGASVVGGSIHRANEITIGSDRFFLKHNHRHAEPMFESERRGLALLRRACTETGADIHIPAVLHTSAGQKSAPQKELSPGLSQPAKPSSPRPEPTSPHAWILLDFIPEGSTGGDFFRKFGSALAAMHRFTNPAFGLDHHNFIGSLPQNNKPAGNWPEFYYTRRLEPQAKRAVDAGLLPRDHILRLEKLSTKLPGLLPGEPASLLHGDLWGGNFLSRAPGNTPSIFDPAVYFGHREADLAFTHLFGGFGPDFYESYRETWPLQPGFPDRIDLYNLYPLLVHVNLFGGSYIRQYQSALSRYL